MTYWFWRLRFWFAFLPWAREAFDSGYRMAWNESRIPGMHLDEAAAFTDWVSRLDDKF